MRRIATRPFGKKVENNIIRSLRMAGVPIKTNADLDHNHKIDFLLILEDKTVGIQFSLRQDNFKAKVAKICALDEVQRFVYLCLADEFFSYPDKDNGMQLYSLLHYITNEFQQKALWLNVDINGWRVKAI